MVPGVDVVQLPQGRNRASNTVGSRAAAERSKRASCPEASGSRAQVLFLGSGTV